MLFTNVFLFAWRKKEWVVHKFTYTDHQKDRYEEIWNSNMQEMTTRYFEDFKQKFQYKGQY